MKKIHFTLNEEGTHLSEKDVQRYTPSPTGLFVQLAFMTLCAGFLGLTVTYKTYAGHLRRNMLLKAYKLNACGVFP